MEKDFTPHEIALSLKELGFNEPCTRGWDKNGKIWYHPDSDIVLDNPTFSQCFRWFREKYNIHYAMKPILGSKNGYDSFPMLGWDYDIFITNKGTQNSYYMGYPVGEWFTATLDMFDEGETLEDLNIHPLSYEEAELECLMKLIEIVKEQNVK